MKRRIQGLNRRVFKRNLRRYLKPEFAKQLNIDSFFESYVDAYSVYLSDTGMVSWFELDSFLTKSGHVELIRTNYISYLK